MSDTTDRIVADLPKIQAIANRPLAQNPLLSVVLEQAMALAKISDWTGNAQQGLAVERQGSAPAETETPPAPRDGIPSVGVPEDAVTLEPSPMRSRKTGT